MLSSIHDKKKRMIRQTTDWENISKSCIQQKASS